MPGILSRTVTSEKRFDTLEIPVLYSRLSRIAVCLFLPALAWSGSRFLLSANRFSQLVQNSRADAQDLSRMASVDMIERFSENGLLVQVPEKTRNYYLYAIPAQYRYLRPWSKLFLDELGADYFARFKDPLRVTSLVRTERQQMKLAGRNVNAARATGSRRSSHLTGATLDISKRFMSSEQQDWMRQTLYSLKKRGYLYAIEEFNQPTFHIMVYRDYLGRSRASAATPAGN